MKRTNRTALCVVLSISCLAGAGLAGLSGCDDDDDEPSLGVLLDAAPIAPGIDAGVSGPPWPGTCDPVQQNCPAGQQCTGGCQVAGVMAKVFTCAVPGPSATATNGQDCGAGCAPGNDCYTVPAAGGGTRSVCRKYCNTNADCPSGTCVAEGLVCTAGDTAPIGRLCSL